MPTGVTEEVNELFVPENKLDLVLSDANILPTLTITEVNASLHEHTHALLCESTALYVTPQAFHHSSVNRKLFTVTSSLEMEIYCIIQFCNSN